jgi:NADPH2:quinone reductase
MKAIRVHEYGDPEVMQLQEVDEPRPAEGQVVVEVRVAGVNPVDTYIRGGTQGYGAEMPYTPGKEAAGVVSAVGPGVGRVAVGDRVYCGGSLSGTYAEKALCREGQTHRLPANVNFESGAGVFVAYTTAYHALHERARPLPGETVLVHGASGGVGIAAVQLARAAGLYVIGTAGDRGGCDLIREQGAHEAVNHASADHMQQILALTGGRGVDVVLEMLANVNLGHDLPILARNGRVVVIGSRGEVAITPRDLMVREAAVMGTAIANLGEAGEQRIQHALYAGLENGSLRPVIGERLPLIEAALAHRRVLASPSRGKVVLVP